MVKIGVSGPFLGWIQEFLSGRSMCVRIENNTSQTRSVENGVPQEAALSPILLNIVMIEFQSATPEVKILPYADDVIH